MVSLLHKLLHNFVNFGRKPESDRSFSSNTNEFLLLLSLVSIGATQSFIELVAKGAASLESDYEIRPEESR
jgi:hypothetical protein